jgi:hypothetical protein
MNTWFQEYKVGSLAILLMESGHSKETKAA